MEEVTKLKEENKLLREMLTAANKLALSADTLLSGSVSDVGSNVVRLSTALREYNQIIIDNSETIKSLNK